MNKSRLGYVARRRQWKDVMRDEISLVNYSSRLMESKSKIGLLISLEAVASIERHEMTTKS